MIACILWILNRFLWLCAVVCRRHNGPLCRGGGVISDMCESKMCVTRPDTIVGWGQWMHIALPVLCCRAPGVRLDVKISTNCADKETWGMSGPVRIQEQNRNDAERGVSSGARRLMSGLLAS